MEPNTAELTGMDTASTDGEAELTVGDISFGFGLVHKEVVSLDSPIMSV